MENVLQIESEQPHNQKPNDMDGFRQMQRVIVPADPSWEALSVHHELYARMKEHQKEGVEFALRNCFSDWPSGDRSDLWEDVFLPISWVPVRIFVVYRLLLNCIDTDCLSISSICYSIFLSPCLLLTYRENAYNNCNSTYDNESTLPGSRYGCNFGLFRSYARANQHCEALDGRTRKMDSKS